MLERQLDERKVFLESFNNLMTLFFVNKCQIIVLGRDGANALFILQSIQHQVKTPYCDACLVKVDMLQSWTALEQVTYCLKNIVIDGRIFAEIEGLQSNTSSWITNLIDKVSNVLRKQAS